MLHWEIPHHRLHGLLRGAAAFTSSSVIISASLAASAFASAGWLPRVETATVILPRRADGMLWKSAAVLLSVVFTNAPHCLASSATARFTAGSFVAAKTSTGFNAPISPDS